MNVCWARGFFLLLLLSFFISHLTAGNLIYLCLGTFLGKLLMDELERLDELF